MTDDELLDAEKAAKRLKRTPARVRQLIAEGQLPAEKLGGAWVLRASDVDAYRPRPQGWPKGRKRKIEPTDDA